MISFLKKSHLILACFLIPAVTEAQNFVPLLQGDPITQGLPPTGGMTVFINRLFGLSIAVAAVLAVIMVSIGGFKYMTSESILNVGGAKEKIAQAIVGLLIVLSAVVILSTINPDIVSLNIFNVP